MDKLIFTVAGQQVTIEGVDFSEGIYLEVQDASLEWDLTSEDVNGSNVTRFIGGRPNDR